jgi:hypothetical protein
MRRPTDELATGVGQPKREVPVGTERGAQGAEVVVQLRGIRALVSIEVGKRRVLHAAHPRTRRLVISPPRCQQLAQQLRDVAVGIHMQRLVPPCLEMTVLKGRSSAGPAVVQSRGPAFSQERPQGRGR